MITNFWIGEDNVDDGGPQPMEIDEPPANTLHEDVLRFERPDIYSESVNGPDNHLSNLQDISIVPDSGLPASIHSSNRRTNVPLDSSMPASIHSSNRRTNIPRVCSEPRPPHFANEHMMNLPHDPSLPRASEGLSSSNPYPNTPPASDGPRTNHYSNSTPSTSNRRPAIRRFRNAQAPKRRRELALPRSALNCTPKLLFPLFSYTDPLGNRCRQRVINAPCSCINRYLGLKSHEDTCTDQIFSQRLRQDDVSGLLRALWASAPPSCAKDMLVPFLFSTNNYPKENPKTLQLGASTKSKRKRAERCESESLERVQKKEKSGGKSKPETQGRKSENEEGVGPSQGARRRYSRAEKGKSIAN